MQDCPHPPNASRRERGAAAEALAAEYLERHGLVVIARNLRCKGGELDLICLDGEVLVIVEVRVRRNSDFGGAADSVTPHKQRKLIRAAQYHWQRRPDWQARIVRFDVIAVDGGSGDSGGDSGGIAWIKDAFYLTT
jgi:putative endonuclease